MLFAYTVVVFFKVLNNRTIQSVFNFGWHLTERCKKVNDTTFLEPQTWPYSKLHCRYILTAFNGLLGSDNAGHWPQIWHFMTPLIGRQCFDFVCPKAPSVHPNWRTRSNTMRPELWSVRPGHNDAQWIQRWKLLSWKTCLHLFSSYWRLSNFL